MSGLSQTVYTVYIKKNNYYINTSLIKYDNILVDINKTECKKDKYTDVTSKKKYVTSGVITSQFDSEPIMQ